MVEAQIQPKVLRWARKRLQFPPESVAQKISVKPEKFALWETGEALPTFRQARELARILRIPFGYLFLSDLPQETVPIPDLRTIKNSDSIKLSVDFMDALNDALRKQDWYKEHLIQEQTESLPYIGAFSLDSPRVEVAEHIRKTLKITDRLRRKAGNWAEFLSLLVESTEKAGILVLRNSIVGNNTSRPLSVEEFRGFALCDKLAPLIFINSRDAKAAQIFTLAHELAHLWIGESGISNPLLEKAPGRAQHQIEQYCNLVSAEVLIPGKDIIAAWIGEQDINENITRLVRRYRVSSLVVLRRALETNLISSEEFHHQYDIELKKQKSVKQISGGDAYTNIQTRNSKQFTQAVLNSAFEGRLLFRDAADLLGVKVKTLEPLERKMEGR